MSIIMKVMTSLMMNDDDNGDHDDGNVTTNKHCLLLYTATWLASTVPLILFVDYSLVDGINVFRCRYY